jgi:hypothetical protein
VPAQPCATLAVVSEVDTGQPRERRSRPIRRAAYVAAVLVLVAAVSGVWVGVRAAPVEERLTRTGDLLQRLERSMQDGDFTGARQQLADLQRTASEAHAAVDRMDWRLLTHLPVVGDDVSALRTVAAVLDGIARDVLPSLVVLAEEGRMHDLVPRAGAVDFSALTRMLPDLRAVDITVGRAYAQIAAIDPDGLVTPLAAAVRQLAGGLARMRGVTSTAARAAGLLPAMLGADGPRRYLVLIQNPAEARATGGMPGAFLVVRVERGRLAIADQGTAASDLGVFDKPVMRLDPDMRALYTDRPAIFPADVNATPHFPTAARLAREMYRRRTGITVDGVVATDPVALSYVLGATGPVRVADGSTLTAGTAVRRLLVDAYAQMSSAEQKNRYFASVARAVFEAIGRGVASPSRAIAALARAAGERRLLVWSAHPEEEAALSGTVLEGALPLHDKSANPTIGVFLNDGSGAKLDYYLTHKVQLQPATCRADGRRLISMRITLGSTAPSKGLPPYVLGLGLAGDPYTARTVLMVFTPTGGAVAGMRLDGAPVAIATGSERNRMVGVLTVDIPPGRSRVIDAEVLTAPSGAGARMTTDLWVTPGVNPWPNDVGSPQACSRPG